MPGSASAMSPLAITTCYRPAPAHLARAHALSARLNVPVVDRCAWPKVFESSGTHHLYVVGRDHDEVRDAAGGACFVQEGLLTVKRGEGHTHPLIRALTGGESGNCVSLVDATLGLANDALHAATILGARVIGIEGSPVLHALLEEGLPRLARTYPAAALITLTAGHALAVLRALPPHSHDVVYLDPMMSRPKRSAPAFEVLRAFAVPEPASPELLLEAARVARRRVVLKLGKGAPLPAGCPLAFAQHEKGAHVTYHVEQVG